MATIETNSIDSNLVNGSNKFYENETNTKGNLKFNNEPEDEEMNSEQSVNTTTDTLENLNLYYDKNSFPITDLYKFAFKFYKDKSGKAVHLSYEDNCQLVALSQQISHGPYNPATSVTLGVLDVVGRDRRVAWQSLGPLSKEDAMKQFVDTLNRLTPTFEPYVEALWADHLEKNRKMKEEELRKQLEEEERLKEEDNKKKDEEEQKKQEETKRRIQEALNQQTFAQFKLYSEQQYPGNPEQQAVLIKQLQGQHYQQYMQQVYQQQLLQQQQQINNPNSQDIQHLTVTDNIVGTREEEESRGDSPCENLDVATEDELQTDEEGNDLAIAPASMWTRRDIKEFKESIKNEGGDSIIKVGHGETVTVRVPTHEDGTCLFWEFATDSYDIGFGVYFEWTKEPSTAVSVHIAESDEDEDEDDPDEENDDVERFAGGTKPPDPNKPPQSIIIPVYRRDCHEEVYAGSHTYPGTGVYLLKFDNSYSLWRNKVLYYRVYYTR